MNAEQLTSWKLGTNGTISGQQGVLLHPHICSIFFQETLSPTPDLIRTNKAPRYADTRKRGVAGLDV